MFQNGRIPLWIVATVAGTGVLVVVGIFFYGSYVGTGSAIQIFQQFVSSSSKTQQNDTANDIAALHFRTNAQKRNTRRIWLEIRRVFCNLLTRLLIIRHDIQ